MRTLRKEEHVYLDVDRYLNLNRRTLVKNGLVIHFSPLEFYILERLVENLGSPVSIKEIAEHAWDGVAPADKKELYVYINRVRKRLEDHPQKPKYLLSVRGFGYLLFPHIDTYREAVKS